MHAIQGIDVPGHRLRCRQVDAGRWPVPAGRAARPQRNRTAQVIVQGKVLDTLTASDYVNHRRYSLLDAVCENFDRLADTCELILDAFRRWWLNGLRAGSAGSLDYESSVEKALDELADGLDAALDVDALFADAGPVR